MLMGLTGWLGCGDDSSASGGGGSGGGSGGAGGSGTSATPGSWELDYDKAFPQDRVLEVTIHVSAEDWQAMLDEMTSLAGDFGSGQQGGVPGGMGGGPPGGMGGGPPGGFGGGPPGGFGGGAPGSGGGAQGGGADANSLIASDPSYAPSTVIVGDEQWANVGVRFKGNSSLVSAWSGGNWKIPLRLKFDAYEDTAPDTKNQRFYGFQSLSLASGWSDTSLLHEKVGTELFGAAGLPVPATAFYAVTLVHGDESQYLGLYTAVELPDEDAFLDRAFGAHDMNVYKPEGDGATFSVWDEASFDKKTNSTEADFSDVLAMYTALTADRSDAETWRAGLEATFDVDGFLTWLAANTALADWDQYGSMSHNYYLVREQAGAGALVWVPWDHTFAFGSEGGQAALSLGLDEVGAGWPLIRFLMDDPVYSSAYREKLAEFRDGPLDVATLSARIDEAHTLIAPYVTGDHAETSDATWTTASAFNASPATLETWVSERRDAIDLFLAP